MATYPAGIYAPREKENRNGVVYDATKKTVAFAEDIVNNDNEIVAVETLLGINDDAQTLPIAGGVLKGKAGGKSKWSTEIFIGADGKVGIGTTNPSTFKLETTGSIGPSADNTYDLGSSGRRWANVYAASFVGGIIPSGFTQGPIVFGGAGGALAQDNALFWDNTSKYLGIGTTGPSSLLHVSKDDAITNIITNVLRLTHTSSGTVAAGFGTGIRFEGERSNGVSGAMGYIAAVWTDPTAGVEDADFVFAPMLNSSGIGTERMRITSAGNVGIETTGPTAKLDINSDILRLRTAKTPATAGAAGNAGDICWDANFLYVCVATNSWTRVAIAAW